MIIITGILTVYIPCMRCSTHVKRKKNYEAIMEEDIEPAQDKENETEDE